MSIVCRTQIPQGDLTLTSDNSSEATPLQHQQLQPFLKTLASFVQGTSTNKRDVGVQCLEALLARPECRKAVWSIPGIIAGYVTCPLTWRWILFDRLCLFLRQFGTYSEAQTESTNELPSSILFLVIVIRAGRRRTDQ
jgi:hypothetical protein